MKKSINLTTGVSDDTVKNHLRSAYNVNVTPKIVVEWDLNRYTSPTVTNTPSEDTHGFDIEAFPIQSIVAPLRPVKGAPKAIIGQSLVASGYQSENSPRFYVSDIEDVYTYWVSPDTTDSLGNFPNHTDGLTTARPKVSYNKVVKANKIVIVFENTWATPKTYEVRMSPTVGGTLNVIGGSNPTIDAATGKLVLYYNGTSWVTARPSNLVSTDVADIQLRVSAMGAGKRKDGATLSYKNRGNASTWVATTGANSNLSVISIGAVLEADLTDRLITVSDSFEMTEKSDLYPIGTITTNTGELSFSNEDGIFNEENSSSIFYGLLSGNAKFTMSYVYNIDGVLHSVSQFVMYGGPWSEGDSVVNVSVEDCSKYLKDIKPRAMMIEGKTSTEIVCRILDSVGFNNYSISEDDFDATIIPVFWTTGDQTVWEVLDEIAKATQTAIYIDGEGVIQVKTRQAAFKEQNPDWNLIAEDQPGALSDILSWNPSGETEANKIDVKYKSTKWKVNSLGKPAMSRIWETDAESMVVRSAQLTRSIGPADTHIAINKNDVKFWPYKSKVQIDGEIISYEGKQFVYYTYTETISGGGTPTYSSPVKHYVSVKSDDEYQRFNNLTPYQYRQNNYFTGGLKIVERAVWNTEKINHPVDVSYWSSKMELNGNLGSYQQNLNPPGAVFLREESTYGINTPPRMNDHNDTFWLIRGNSISSSYNSYGTRFRFNRDSSSKTQVAGISYQLSGTREAGYYVQVRTSSGLTASTRKTHSEVAIYSRSGGKDTMIAKGAPTAIGENIWYDLDVYHSGSGNSQTITVYINGTKVAQGTTNSSTAQSASGRFGFFAKGSTNVKFEYIYAIARSVREPLDDYGFYDLKYGGIRGWQWEREYVWEMRTRRTKIRKKKWTKETYRHNLYVFDEFGPYVHEIREFDVRFDPAPVKYSYLFNTNDSSSAVPEYNSNPFGAKFIVANTSRTNAVIHGEDKETFAGSGSAVNQVCVVLGQNLEISDEETVTEKNEQAIRSNGVVESELSSNWIQSKEMAEELAKWMSNHWSDGVDEVQVEIFGNPVLELTDIVDVDYPEKHASPATHKYFVTGINTAFENGIRTTLTLRRKLS